MLDICLEQENPLSWPLQIYRQIRIAIIGGHLRDGDSLPSAKELARHLAVSEDSVGAAYEWMSTEGLLECRINAPARIRTGVREVHRTRQPVVPLGFWADLPKPPLRLNAAPEYDFRAGVPDTRIFPMDTWLRLLAEQMTTMPPQLLIYEDPRGRADLRREIAVRLHRSRELQVRATDVLVTNGSQQAVHLAARVLLRPGDRVAVENPGYPPPRQMFTSLGAEPVGVRVDSEGLVVDEIPDDCRLVYVTPAHQFPLGMPMSLRRKLDLLAWARRRSAVIVEDDYDTELKFTERPLEPLHSLCPDGQVIYVGSFSKVLLPMLRLGFLVAPPELMPALAKAKYLTDVGTPSVEQAALARFLAEGGFADHLRGLHEEYGARRGLLIDILARDFGDVLTLVPSEAGLHVTARAEYDMWPLVQAARRAGIWLYSLGDFTDPPNFAHGLLFGYGAMRAEAIESGLRKLREIFHQKGRK
ncbi:PLP-dependent aminotransferase family protein [Embleya sp. NBC_00888]|uniref:MocR-like pyridoxine biosynthesis transcription factor PdxR n=1 Tax=Embleya sp. NBC_00888 TaxID=2975960 RepID=UPI00386E9E8D|nr:PLP-dependent aminotransferase family protein [Embleya sp. NBC_00888]